MKSCVTEYPSIENATVSYDRWDGKYPAPPGSRVIYTCPHSSSFNDGSDVHNATCSVRIDDTWDSSFHDRHVRCQVYPECRLTNIGMEYMGTMNVTKTGKRCLRWNSAEVKPYIEKDGQMSNFFGDIPSEMNFCRNPDFHEMPWCYVDNNGLREDCWIPLCDDQRTKECKTTASGNDYKGSKNWTIFGAPCLPWTKAIEIIKKSGEERFLIYSMLGSPMADHNYCRSNILTPYGPWCFIEWNNMLGKDYYSVIQEDCHVRSCFREEMEKASETVEASKSIGAEAMQIYPECRMTTMGKEYRGTHSRTQTGMNCTDWKTVYSQQAQNMGNVFPGFSLFLFHLQLPGFEKQSAANREYLTEFIFKQDLNYCRNPTSAEQPWCFVSSYGLWEFCDIPFCPGSKGLRSFGLRGYYAREKPVECRLTEEGLEYAGFKNLDAGGRKCQPWLTSNAKRFQLLNFLAFPDERIDYSFNYCRNPDPNNESLWCFIEGEETLKGRGQCNVPFCYQVYERSALEGKPAQGYPECLQTKMGKEYVGTTRKTISGKPCLRWDAKPYGKPEDFDPKLSYDDHFRFGNAALHQDFCRNPTLKKQPWCFVADPEKKLEFCNIPLCPNYPNKTECKWTHKGEEYAGTLNVTVSGRSCLPWSDSGLREQFWPRFPEDVSSEDHNFCRNPTGRKDLAYCLIYWRAIFGHNYQDDGVNARIEEKLVIPEFNVLLGKFSLICIIGVLQVT
ncbi:unnamed protein product [Darwinula stevensoni]|uniref:Kringle domain-containing protein n=1 Tax=Darwinula stevensoni TaxID=69355 RepID=A0A7R9AA52_9CRUS|nr:unnamed protein product [Darwinula stevensoni]CAG0898087.1 unnamed protein product [Darwinula stevensoni]